MLPTTVKSSPAVRRRLRLRRSARLNPFRVTYIVMVATVVLSAALMFWGFFYLETGSGRDAHVAQDRHARPDPLQLAVRFGRVNARGQPGGASETKAAAAAEQGEEQQPPAVEVHEEEEEEQEQEELSPQTLSRRAAIVEGMKYAWDSYDSKCFGQDELKPTSQSCGNWLNQGLTITDALDTLHVMGLSARYEKAAQWVFDHLQFNRNVFVSFFETTIRSLGGLNAAHSLTGDERFLRKSVELADKLLVAFATKTGLPHSEVNLGTGAHRNFGWTGGASVLAEVGTVQIEFMYLSQHTGDRRYHDAAQRVVDFLERSKPRLPGLWPIYIHPESGAFTTQKVTFGAMGDSAFEYLLKLWLLHGKRQEQYRRMYVTAMDTALKELVRTDGPNTYVADYEAGRLVHKQDHLACFTPGMLALGVHTGAVDGERAKEHLRVAEALMETCYQTYAQSPSGIAPEFSSFGGGRISVGAPMYHLRPETVESLMILWRVTKDQKWRDYGWNIWTAIEKHCRVPTGGYTGLHDVRAPARKQDKQESFFLAETLKYLYMLFSGDDVLNLHRFVFNTECHPVAVFDSK